MQKQNAREVVFTMVVGLLVIYYFTQNNSVFYGALGLGVLAVLFEPFAIFIAKYWMLLGHAMGAIMTPLLMGFVFYLFLTPLAFLQKLFSKNDHLKLKEPTTTVYDTRDHNYTAADFENLW
jgi:hypothetical protein